MVAASVGRLMEEDQRFDDNEVLRALRKERWITPITKLLPDDFVLEDSIATSQITIEDALSHRTGLSGADNLYGSWMGAKPKAVVKALRYMGALSKPFRTAWQYNNMMYSVIGDVLETATGLDWGDAVRQMLWEPLGMSSTFWHPDEIPADRKRDLARGYFWDPSKSPEGSFIAEPYVEFACISPAGSVISSVTDYAKWIRALLTAAKLNESSNNTDVTAAQTKVITPTLFSDLTTPRIPSPLPPSLNKNSHLTPRLYSLGWHNVTSTAGVQHPILTHAGGLTGFGAQVHLLPNDAFGCVALGNTAMTSNVVGQSICNELMARKLGLLGGSKVEFIDSLNDFTALERTATHNVSASSSFGSHGGDTTEAASIRTHDELCGAYRHPAYGLFRVSPLAPSKLPIVYGILMPDQDRRELENHRSNGTSLEVWPNGQRAWPNHFVLHPRKVDETLGKNEHDILMYDLEGLTKHGQESTSTSTETLKDLDHGSRDFEKTEKQLKSSTSRTAFESGRLCRFGAAFKRSNSPSYRTSIGTSEQPWSLGLRLAKEYLAVEGTTKGDWETEMVWFEKET